LTFADTISVKKRFCRYVSPIIRLAYSTIGQRIPTTVQLLEDKKPRPGRLRWSAFRRQT
jgi:hypothetical protein